MNNQLPPLPEPDFPASYPGAVGLNGALYTADQMTAYARAALAQQPTLYSAQDMHEYARVEVLAALAQQPAKACQPLMDEQVFANDAIMEVNAHAGLPMRWLMEIARAVESAHGITGEDAA